jgi:glycosyltransferase involved in cell wall biosynthesis
MPLVSIIIPAYNREGFLNRAIDSVLQQTVQDHELEVIVVDDGSRDGTAIIAQQFAMSDSRVRLVRHENKRGAQAARNTGAQIARGQWLTFLDSDDILLPNSLELRLKMAAAEKADVVHSDCYVLRKDSPRRLFGVPSMRGSIYKEVLAKPGPMFQGMLISARSFAAIGGVDERVVAFQEWDTAIRLAKICSFAFVAEPTFVYDCTGDDNISKNLLSGARGYEYIVHKHRTEIVRRLGPKAISQHYRTIASQYSQAGDFNNAAKANLRSFLWWPSPRWVIRSLRPAVAKILK